MTQEQFDAWCDRHGIVKRWLVDADPDHIELATRELAEHPA